ncbi:MAG: 50S ribosomal protein L9 [Candidatus Omnitrophica bacterium]|nr:50S ribosomal protein L9 [Candidatus Omnitrophota bacterium]
MDVILVKDVDRVGKAEAVVHVKPGYARNFLLPRGLAVPATEEQRRAVEAKRRQAEQKATRARTELESLKQRVQQHSLSVKLTTGEHGATFGSVTARDIVDALARDGITVEKQAVQLDEPFKALGIYDVPVRLAADVTATLKVWVVKA